MVLNIFGRLRDVVGCLQTSVGLLRTSVGLLRMCGTSAGHLGTSVGRRVTSSEILKDCLRIINIQGIQYLSLTQEKHTSQYIVASNISA